MKAINFIQQHGVDKAREVVEGAPEGSTKFNTKTGEYLKTIKVATIGYPSSGMVVQACLIGLNEAYSIELSDLKRLVGSIDHINACGGLHGFKTYCNGDFSQEDLQAIADYEQLFGNTETLELETLRDCDTSPNCKKFDERVK